MMVESLRKSVRAKLHDCKKIRDESQNKKNGARIWIANQNRNWLLSLGLMLALNQGRNQSLNVKRRRNYNMNLHPSPKNPTYGFIQNHESDDENRRRRNSMNGNRNLGQIMRQNPVLGLGRNNDKNITTPYS